MFCAGLQPGLRTAVGNESQFCYSDQRKRSDHRELHPSHRPEPRLFWSRSTGILDINPPGSFSSTGSAISGNGKVAGYVDPCACQLAAFWWKQSTGSHELAVPGEFASSGTGINNSGEVVGTYLETFTGPQKGFIWTTSAGFQHLDDLGCVSCLPNGVNDNGQLAGEVSQPDGSQHAFVWSPAKGFTDLGTLGGPNSRATALNKNGQVVGTSDTADGFQHAFFWSRATGLLDLGVLAGFMNSWGNAIDAAGTVVGSSWSPGNNNGKPFTWSQAGGLQELGPYSVKALSSADGINTAGEILLSYFGPRGPASYLLTPIMHTTFTATPNPVKSGQPVTLVATVSSAVHPSPPDGEMVSFLNSGTVLGSAPLQSGVATFVTSLTSTRAIVAEYLGDSNYASSKSPSLTVVVTK